jgi:AAA domain
VSWRRVDLTAAEYARPTEPPIVRGLLYRGKRHAISGPPEAAKTLAALILGLEHMRHGHGPFALVDFEMGQHATRLMLDELGATPDEINAVYYIDADGPPDQTDIANLVDAGVKLVIIDAAAGAYDASELDDNKRADAERFARTWVEPFYAIGIATATLDHVVKNPETRGRYAIGSERKLGGVDVHLGLEAVTQLTRGGRGIVKVTVHKDRPGHLPRPTAAELHLASDPDTHRITWQFETADAGTNTGDDWRPTVLMDRVKTFLGEQTEPLSKSAIARHVGGNKRYVLQAIDFLIHDRVATEEKGPRDARLISLAPPVPDPFRPVPERVPTQPVLPFHPPTRGNGNGNGSTERHTPPVPENGSTDPEPVFEEPEP